MYKSELRHYCGLLVVTVPGYLSLMVKHLPCSWAIPTSCLSITCSVQMWRGKALEIWSCAVMSGRQRVDRLGPVLMKDLDALSCDV